MPQLPLSLRLADHARFETFVAGANSAAVAQVRAASEGAAAAVWLFGPRGVGKSHLLQASCRSAASCGRRAMYVQLGPASGLPPEALADLEHLDLLALDDVGAIAGNAGWERRLFLVLEERLNRSGLLLAADTAAKAVGFALPDLASRAAAAVAYRLQPPDDSARVDALLVHADARGLELERAAAQYLLQRVDRDMAALLDWLDRLDSASLAEQRRLTIPFIRRLLEAERLGEKRG